MSLTEIAIKRPSLIVVIFTVLTVLGLFSYNQLSYELLPKISPPVLTVVTVYPGASPSEVESAITKKIENAVSSLEKVSSVRGTSQEGVSFVFVEFFQDAKIDKMLQEGQRKVAEISDLLPTGSKPPKFSKFALDEIPVLRMGATSNIEDREFYTIFKRDIQAKLAQVPGVGNVTLVGGEEREIKINVKADKLKGYNLNLMQIGEIVKASNLEFPTGTIKDEDGEFTVRIAGKFSLVEQLKHVVVGKSRQGGDIKLYQVAEIEDGIKEVKQINRINTQTSIGIMIQKQSDANAVEVSKLVRLEIAKLEKEFSKIKLKFDIAQDGSQYTMDAANAVKHDLYLAVFLVAIVMLLFLHSLRNSFIVMLAIPASLISTFIAMYVLGFSLNLMTLLGLSLVVGILVDDSIVVLENIYRHLEMGKDKRTAALDGRNEIGFTALSITLVDVVVFLPLAFTTGIVGNIMREFSIVVVVSTLLSLFVSFTVTPMLASRISKLEHLNENTFLGFIGTYFEKFYEWLTNQYLILLGWSIRHKIIVLILTTASFFGSFALLALGFIGGEFVTPPDRGEFSISLEASASTSITETNKITRQAEQIIAEIPEVSKVLAVVGASNDGLIGFSSNNLAEITVTLVPKLARTRSTDEIGKVIKEKMQVIPGLKVRVAPVGLFGTANQTPLQMIIKGSNYDSIYHSAEIIADSMRSVSGSADVRLSAEKSKPEVKIELDKVKMSQFSLTVAEVGMTLRTVLSGNDDSKFSIENEEYDIRVQYDKADKAHTQQLEELTFVTRMGKTIQLKQFAKVVRSQSPSKLERKDRSPSVVVLSQAIGRPSGTIGGEMRDKINKAFDNGTLNKENIKVFYDGDMKNQKEGSGSMGTALQISILFVYLIMVALYDSYIYPFVVLFSIPLAIVGALLALALTMNSMNIFTMLGMIMLVGLVAKNAILLVDFTTQLRAEGVELYAAIMEAGKQRLRPILMTTLAMVIGMLPIAIAGGAGSEWKAGLAWVLIGGLSSSMILTLVIVPIVYIIVTRLVERFNKLVSRFSK